MALFDFCIFFLLALSFLCTAYSLIFVRWKNHIYIESIFWVFLALSPWLLPIFKSIWWFGGFLLSYALSLYFAKDPKSVKTSQKALAAAICSISLALFSLVLSNVQQASVFQLTFNNSNQNSTSSLSLDHHGWFYDVNNNRLKPKELLNYLQDKKQLTLYVEADMSAQEIKETSAFLLSKLQHLYIAVKPPSPKTADRKE